MAQKPTGEQAQRQAARRMNLLKSGENRRRPQPRSPAVFDSGSTPVPGSALKGVGNSGFGKGSPAGNCCPAYPGSSALAGWEGITVPKMTPAQEAAYALDFNMSRDDLKPEVQAEYDRL